MSSTHAGQVRHAGSLTHLPHWPCCFQAQGLCITRRATLWNSSTLPPGSNFWPLPLDQLRLVVERVDLAGGAGHEELDDALGLGRVVQAAVEVGPRLRRRAGRRAEQVRQRDAAQAAAGLPEELAAVELADCGSSWLVAVQSTNTNSLVLNSTRQAFARPCSRGVARPGRRAPRRVGGRPSARRYAASICRAGVVAAASQARGEVLRLPDHERVVQQRQRLQRRERRVAHRRVHVRVGAVEALQERVRHAADDEAVDRAAARLPGRRSCRGRV